MLILSRVTADVWFSIRLGPRHDMRLPCLTQLTRLTFAGHPLCGYWQRPETPLQKRCAAPALTPHPSLEHLARTLMQALTLMLTLTLSHADTLKLTLVARPSD